jgi:hypothetical protein
MYVFLMILFIIMIYILAINVYAANLKSGAGENHNRNLISQYISQDLVSKALDKTFRHFKTDIISKQAYNQHKDENPNEKIFKELNIDITDANFESFFDICCNPGSLTLYALDSNPKISGYGVSLPIKDGGYEANPRLKNHPRFKIYYADILDSKQLSKIDSAPRTDIVFISCFIGHNKEKNTYALYANSYRLAFKKLKIGGTLMNVLSYRWDVNILLNTLWLFSQYFDSIHIYKDNIYTPGLSILYIAATNFKDVNNKILDKYTRGEQLYDEEFIKKWAPQINKYMADLIKYHIDIITEIPKVREVH